MEERGKEADPLLEEELERLTLSLKEGNKENMSRALSVLEEKIRDSYAEKSRACVYLQQIIRAVDASCDNTVEDTRAVTRERDRLLRRVTEENTFRKAMGLVRTYAGKVYDAQLEMNSSSSQRQARMALDYIQKNYSDPNLSLNSICSYLNISTSYFSTIFKEATGETFTEVLIRTRMEKAKELLAGTTMKNYEIAEKVGFSDPHYFGISFKKMTGMTPTEYARENRK